MPPSTTKSCSGQYSPLPHSNRRNAYLAINKARLITGQEQDGLRLLNSLTKPSTREMNLSSMSLRHIITQPILQKRSIQRRGTKCIESESLSGMHNSQLSRHGQDRSFARRVSQLRSSGTDQSDDGGGVNNGAPVLVVVAHGDHGVLAAEPDTFDVDGLGQVPDLLGSVDGVCIIGVHYACVVEHDVYSTPGVQMVDEGFDVGFFGDVADLALLVNRLRVEENKGRVLEYQLCERREQAA